MRRNEESDSERSARRVAGRNREVFEAERNERAHWRLDDKLAVDVIDVIEDRFGRLGRLRKRTVMAGQTALIAGGFRCRTFVAVFVATCRALMGLGLKQKGRSQRTRTHRRHHDKHNDFCQVPHRYTVGCPKAT
jgi:hypothetical protein